MPKALENEPIVNEINLVFLEDFILLNKWKAGETISIQEVKIYCEMINEKDVLGFMEIMEFAIDSLQDAKDKKDNTDFKFKK